MAGGGKQKTMRDTETNRSTTKTLAPQYQGLVDQQFNTLQGFQPYGGERVAGMDPSTTWGLNRNIQLGQQGTPLPGIAVDSTGRRMDYQNPIAPGMAAGAFSALQPGISSLANIAGGGDYAANPHLAAATEAAMRPASEAFRYGTNPLAHAQMTGVGRGRGAGGAVEGRGGIYDRAETAYARELQDTASRMAMQSAEAERNRQLQAGGQLGNLGANLGGAAGQFFQGAQGVQQGAANQYRDVAQGRYDDSNMAIAAGDRFRRQQQAERDAQYKQYMEPFQFATGTMGSMTPFLSGAYNTAQNQTTDRTYSQPSTGQLIGGWAADRAGNAFDAYTGGWLANMGRGGGGGMTQQMLPQPAYQPMGGRNFVDY